MIRASIKTKVKTIRKETFSLEIKGGLPANRLRPADGQKDKHDDVLSHVLPAKEVRERE